MGNLPEPARNPLNFITNQNDIESMIRDTAIYGSRGANGVIVITTKKKGSQESLNCLASTCKSVKRQRFDVMTSEQFVAAGGDDKDQEAN
jgi:iron complex outermembrane receptor protein